ncbi:UDP-N-acetylglucosamine 1-carboxyvinyltransferase [Mogibacterium pumilum]|uniref:UDP-N-acetylglucosamine 1-carboxyvinyltransferase n=1 Tax=Mogibacterium pumilum TaxID=86332 RepID=A0A223ATM3_9FIRM|nr:UDP-N-acetylglucosamine 1-carboxyvinyltransferase [Mogibacterium pumilum]ASS38320.1 UDP-N-acetylglucosamine 1-carboxyvinyltransferase [Mogibacterium pumilum]
MAKILVNNSGSLEGEVKISGAKNAVLPLMAATLLTPDTCVIDGVPELSDVMVMHKMLESFGAVVSTPSSGRLSVSAAEITTVEGDAELVSQMRASTMAMGPLLARFGKVVMPLPGGCTIGKRPIDLHLKGFKALGATVTEDLEHSCIVIEAPEDGLVGDAIYLDFPSVGATENILMAAALAKGPTIIENAAKEPEIVDLANMLNKMGAKIKGAGTDTIRITGVEGLSGAIHTVIPDRIECGTFMLAAAITRGKVLIKNGIPGHVRPIIAKLKECGVKVDVEDYGILVDATEGNLVATDIKTLPYPGFPTDIQSPFMAFLTTVEGTSVVRETVFENRFMHVVELNRMGADISADNSREATIPGGKQLHGAKVRSTDLRAGAAMVLAGLVATGTTEVSEIYHIERGYEDFVGKFKSLGADLMRVEEHDV